MATPATKEHASVDEAFAQVVAALKTVVSLEVLTLVKTYRGIIAAVFAGLVVVQVGIILVALGIRDAFIAAMPNSAAPAVMGLGLAAPLAVICLLLLFLRPKKPSAQEMRAQLH